MELKDIAEILEAIFDVLDEHPSLYPFDWLYHEALSLYAKVDALLQD